MKMNSMNSPLRWPGGKRLTCKRIVEMFPSHVCFVEAFAGAAWVTFKKGQSEVEVLNDIHSDLINFYQVIKTKPYQFLLELQWELCSRQLFMKYKNQLENPEGLSDVERAKNFFYILKTSFAGMMETYGYAKTARPGLNLVDIEEIVLKVHERLKRVNIESLDWRKLIPKYDSPNTLFFFDPPYRCKSAGRMYIQSFSDDDFCAFKDTLNALKGKFILTLNKDEFICELFKDFSIEELETRYSMNANLNKAVSELLIRNY